MNDEDVKFVYDSIKNQFFVGLKSQVWGYVKVVPDIESDALFVTIDKGADHFVWDIANAWKYISGERKVSEEINKILSVYKKHIVSYYFK